MTYTYPADGRATPISGLTASEVALERLIHDGRLFDLRRDGAGWQLYVSQRSANSYGGAGKMVPAYAGGRVLYSAAASEEKAWEEIALRVVNADWPGVPDAMTDDDYRAMLADGEA